MLPGCSKMQNIYYLPVPCPRQHTCSHHYIMQLRFSIFHNAMRWYNLYSFQCAPTQYQSNAHFQKILYLVTQKKGNLFAQVTHYIQLGSIDNSCFDKERIQLGETFHPLICLQNQERSLLVASKEPFICCTDDNQETALTI